jgi:DNA-binding NarL/FixJ family response regulator
MFQKETMRHASKNEVGIYLVAANRLLREALAHVLSAEEEFNFVGAGAPDAGTENAVLASGASVVLLEDFGAARDDLKLMAKLISAAPSLKVILVGMPETERTFLDSVRAGAVGYLLHDASTEEITSSVHAVLNGEAACPTQMIVSLYKYVPGSGIACPDFAPEKRQTIYAPHAALRALHFFSHTT